MFIYILIDPLFLTFSHLYYSQRKLAYVSIKMKNLKERIITKVFDMDKMD